MTLNCIHIFIVTGSFLYWCVMRPASQRFFIHSCSYLRILITPYLATFLGTSSLSVLMCRKTINQSILASLHWLKMNERIKYRVLSHTYNSVKTGQPSYLHSHHSFPSHRSILGFLLLSPLVALLLPLVLKLQTDLYIILNLLCGKVSHLIYVTLLITSLLLLY